MQMSTQPPTKIHEHVAKRVHVLLQRAGVPYEIEQQICADCSRVLNEKPVKRASLAPQRCRCPDRHGRSSRR